MNPKIGLLPLYIELYDRTLPELRPKVESFLARIAEELRIRGLDVVSQPVCRVRNEFEGALDTFEKAHVDALVSLHLAYSPSLESVDLLATCPCPLIVLDTTPAYSFGPSQDPQELLYNHGIHGVQDLCSMLLRRRKKFFIEAGHWEKSDVLDRVVSCVRASQLASRMRKSRVGLIGRPFEGMGDFAVPQEQLRHMIGMEIIPARPSELAELVQGLKPAAIEEEIRRDHETCIVDGVTSDSHFRTTQTSLAVRTWVDLNRLSAFTFNFMEVDQESGLPTVPFLEASKAMARGIGYAGEGDVLTAAMVGALASVFPDTTFTEMFCPDWESQRIFLSHMGEMNPRIAAGRLTLKTKPFPFTNVSAPVAPAGRFRGGDAALVNLAPQGDDSFSLIAAPVTMLNFPQADSFEDAVRGWFRPHTSVPDFLEEYSRHGGTHHLALVYGDVTRELTKWGELMDWKTVVLT
jgi:L-arabinose isomerase